MTRRRKIGLAITILAILVFWIVMSAIPALSLVRSEAVRTVHVDEAADVLQRERAFLAGQVETTRDPLLALAVDPVTRTATVMLAGVPLRTVTADEMSVSYTLRRSSPDSVIMARLASRDGLIAPEPIRRVDAPADTAEANQAPAEVPVETTPAAVNLVLDNGIVIRMTPNDREGRDHWAIVRYRLFERLRTNLVAAWDAMLLAPPRIRGEVTLSVKDADAKALYRALSDGSPVVIRSAH